MGNHLCQHDRHEAACDECTALYRARRVSGEVPAPSATPDSSPPSRSLRGTLDPVTDEEPPKVSGNESYVAGFKAGWRAGRTTSSGRDSSSEDDTYKQITEAYTRIGSLDDFERAMRDLKRVDWLEEKNAQVRQAPILPASCGYSVRQYIDGHIQSENTPCAAEGSAPLPTRSNADG